MWYDILAFDYMYGWIPINIKTTTTLTSDNTGNLAMCVYAYTDEMLDIHRDKSYENGKMSEQQFDSTIIDLVTFLTYVSEPEKNTRKSIGALILLYLLIFLIVAYQLKKSYWKDIN